MFPTSEFFSEGRFEIRRARQSFWHQGEVSSLKIEEVSFSLDFFLFLTNTKSLEVAGSHHTSPGQF
jgi:hypothetical protein